MSYIIEFSERARKEYGEALDWYLERSVQACENFIKAIAGALDSISDDPYLSRNKFSCFFEIKLKKYPFNVVFTIEDDVKKAIIVSIFHNKRNPENKYVVD